METILANAKTNIDYWEEVVKNQPASYKSWFEKEKEYLRKIITPDSMVLDVGYEWADGLFDIALNFTGALVFLYFFRG